MNNEKLKRRFSTGGSKAASMIHSSSAKQLHYSFFISEAASLFILH